MKKVFERHETLFCILLIVVYVVVNSFCMQNFGETDYRSVIVNSILSIVVILFISKNKLGEYYGLTKFPKFKEFLYFIPLLILMSVNLWSGVQIKNTSSEIIFYILFMICVGFLEEIICPIPNVNDDTSIAVFTLSFAIILNKNPLNIISSKNPTHIIKSM